VVTDYKQVGTTDYPHFVLFRGRSVKFQTVALVYINGSEYRVSAPPAAIGDALEWEKHFSVRQPAEFNSEIEVRDAFAILAQKEVVEALRKHKRNSNRAEGMHPDGVHCDAQICLNGHVQHCDGSFSSNVHCTKCGAPCIDECTNCKDPIRGSGIYQLTSEYVRPLFCHNCGHPYPWMDKRLRSAFELLQHDDKLSLEDRNELWDLLQYVMSDPKADLSPAKKKLIDIKLGKATALVKDALLDLMAKTAAEVLKG
jgi:hypothetical protein